ncbi:MAG: C39 family peptidase [Chloroflexota bacterium]|nr:C39 family peptidase [Chloroflexota bacterium]
MRQIAPLWGLCFAIVGLALALPSPARADEPPPPSAAVEGVVGHPQERNLSCESRSSADLAAYWGVEFTEDAFFRRLPKSDNPRRGFVGNVDMPPGSMPPVGYGVYAVPVAATLRSFGLDAEAHRPLELESLKRELAAQRPVVVWATYDMQRPGVETWVSWDGVASTVVRWQHTFIVVGYDERGLSLIDAFDGQTKRFSYQAFVPAWDQLGRMAVTAAGPLGRRSPRTWTLTGFENGPHFLVAGRWNVGLR